MTKPLTPAQISRLVFVAFSGFLAITNAKAVEATYAQRLACTPDAFKLCFSAIPDAEAVKTCMIAKKSELSASCRATFPKLTASR